MHHTNNVAIFVPCAYYGIQKRNIQSSSREVQSSYAISKTKYRFNGSSSRNRFINVVFDFTIHIYGKENLRENSYLLLITYTLTGLIDCPITFFTAQLSMCTNGKWFYRFNLQGIEKKADDDHGVRKAPDEVKQTENRGEEKQVEEKESSNSPQPSPNENIVHDVVAT